MKLKHILIMSLVLTLVSCTSILLGVNRERLANRLEQAELDLPEGLAEVLAKDIPGPIAKFIAEGEHDDYAAKYVRCLRLNPVASDESLHAAQEYVCICKRPRTMNYVAVLTQRDRQWTTSWDTVFTCHWPSLQVDTVRLGIEMDSRPTIQIRGAVGEKGMDEYHLIRWDGVAGTHVIQRSAIGHWREILDIDGDGIMELNIPRESGEPGVWSDQVFTIPPATNEYTLDTEKDFPAERGHLEFEAHLPKDTFLTYESIWVTFVARNKSRVPFPFRHLVVTSADICMTIFGANGNRVGGHNLQVNEGLASFVDNRSCMPGDTLVGVSTIDENVSVFDATLSSYVTPPGVYMAVFEWSYDKFRRPIFNRSRLLQDTIHYVVVDPNGVNAAAMEAWRALNWNRKLTAEDAEQLMDVYREFPSSPYGPMALSRVICATDGGYMPLPGNVDSAWLNREMALTYPDYPSIGMMLNDFKQKHSDSEIEDLLAEIRDSVPNTLAGRLAEGYFSTPQ